MAMSSGTLSTELQEIENAATEPPVLDGWEAAWQAYFLESEVQGVNPSSESVFSVATAAFKAGLLGISSGATAVDGATKIVTAHKAFWAALAPLVATVWEVTPPLASLVTPPPWILSSQLETAYINGLAAIFTANTAANLPKDQAYDAVTVLIHTNNLGATVVDTTVPTPVVWPIT